MTETKEYEISVTKQELIVLYKAAKVSLDAVNRFGCTPEQPMDAGWRLATLADALRKKIIAIEAEEQ